MVIDASALVEFLVGRDTVGDTLRTDLARSSWAAPHAVDLECVSTLRGLVRGKKISANEAEDAIELLSALLIRRFDHVPLLPRIWELRHNMWPYDAAYVALAELLTVELVTIDAKVERVPGLRCSVRTVR
ncbi:type II toxin-antitoxin system VapC family toxin [Saccharomonospora piscinae]|nr:type II toxin-antitoxin system VapC family toxin [Saccharomonospora piscinae]